MENGISILEGVIALGEKYIRDRSQTNFDAFETRVDELMNWIEANEPPVVAVEDAVKAIEAKSVGDIRNLPNDAVPLGILRVAMFQTREGAPWRSIMQQSEKLTCFLRKHKPAAAKSVAA